MFTNLSNVYQHSQEGCNFYTNRIAFLRKSCVCAGIAQARAVAESTEAQVRNREQHFNTHSQDVFGSNAVFQPAPTAFSEA